MTIPGHRIVPTSRGRSIEIRYAAPSDAAALSKLAARTFRDAFADQNTPEDMELHVARTFGTERIERELEDPAAIVLLAFEDARKRWPVGYARLLVGSGSDSVPGTAPIELERLYVDQALHGLGIGHELMKACLEEADQKRCDTIWLGVWEHNERAIAFYRRCGFEQVGTQIFRLGLDNQTDLVLARPVGSAPPPPTG